jgi:spermidine/putrescine transport system ATP-binding protein
MRSALGSAPATVSARETEGREKAVGAIAAGVGRTAVRVDRVSMVYPGAGSHKALDEVSLDIRENEFFTLLGPSGCGKTTLLRLIAGFEQPTAGELQLDGQSLVGKLPFERPVNTVFQSYALFPHMTVAQNIAFGLEMQNVQASRVSATVAEMLELVRLTALGGRKPAQLSGGQQQRVALARALATRPRVLLLDESLSALDLQLRRDMQVELKRLQRDTGITFVFVTHDQEEALTMSDRIAVMNGGRIQQIGSPTEIYDQPVNRFVASFIGEMNVLQGRVDSGGFDVGAAGRWPLPASMQAALQSVAGGGAVRVLPVDGRPISVAVRPERLRISRSGSDSSGALHGTIDDAIYLGNDTTYLVSVAGQPLLKVRQQNTRGARQSFERGDAVCLHAEADALQVIED